MNHSLKISLSAALIAAATANIHAAADSGLVLPIHTDQTDNTTQYTIIDSLISHSANLYRNVKTLKAQKVEYPTLFANVYETYQASSELLPHLDQQSLLGKSVKDILVNINPDLEAAAYYYSSQSDSESLNMFARAYLDTQLMDEMSDVTFTRNQEPFSQLSYIAASDAYNKGEYEKAIEYFKLYFSTGVAEHRENVYTFMGQACCLTDNYALAITTLADGIKQYPDNLNMPLIGYQACINGKMPEYMHDFIDKAVAQSPDDVQLLEAQGKLYEDEYEFRQALEIFNKIEELKPKRLNTAKHIALCHYNMGVDYRNKAANEPNEKAAVKLRRQAKNHFSAAAEHLEEITTADPMSVRYLTMLGRCYLGLEEGDKLDTINRKLGALGANTITDHFNIPSMRYNENGGPNYISRADGSLVYGDTPPLYTEFATDYIKSRLDEWVKKGEFETIEQYNARVNDATVEARYRALRLSAQQEYLDKFSGKLHLSNMKLMPYDTTNETFLIETNYGPISIKVSNVEKEAETFKQNWEGMRFRNPKYIIADNKVQVASVTIVAPYGKSYDYDCGREPAYSHTLVSVDLEAILKSADTETANQPRHDDDALYVVTKKSDVDINIPVTNKPQKNTFALIIANENYTNVGKVNSAIHDGEVFAEYCQKTLGLPEFNITIYKNATYGTMIGAINQLKNLVQSWGDNAEVIFYYAGHGMPDEKTHDAFILPTDAMPAMSNTAISLEYLYKALEDLKCKSVTVLMDACFSGATRDGDMLYKARSVVLDPKESAPRGNMFILTAATGKETAMHYPDKNHGLFTYFLLKKIQDTKGNVTLKELADYVAENVSRTANLVLKKPQTPTVSTSGEMTNQFKTKKLR